MDREELIKSKIIAQEIREMYQIGGIKKKVFEYLIKEKKYALSDLIIDPRFELKLSNCVVDVTIDFIITVSSEDFAVIRCAPASIESWERYVVSFARVVKDYQIPYAMVTDGEDARIIDVIEGKLIGNSINNFFSKMEAEELIKNIKKIPCPIERLEREKRIVYAFEGVKCPSIKD